MKRKSGERDEIVINIYGLIFFLLHAFFYHPGCR